MTKSIPQEVNIDMGIGNGCSRPVGKDVEPLVFLQISDTAMNLLTEAYSFCHQTLVNKE